MSYPGLDFRLFGHLDVPELAALQVTGGLDVRWFGDDVGTGSDDTDAFLRALAVARFSRRPLLLPMTADGYSVAADTVDLSWDGAALLGEPGTVLNVTGTGLAGVTIDGGAAPVEVTPDSTTGLFTAVDHDFSTGDGPVLVASDDTLPDGIDGSTRYWIERVDDDTFYLTTLPGRDRVSYADNGAGTITVDLSLHRVVVKDLIISGNDNVTHGVYARSVHRSLFSGLRIRNVANTAFRLEFGVDNVVDRLVCSVNVDGADWTTVPVTGVYVGNRTADGDAADHSAGTVFQTPIIEGVSGAGIALNACDATRVFGGTSEGNGDGLTITANGGQHRFVGTWFEANATADVTCAGFYCTFDGVFSTNLVTFSAAAYKNVLRDGLYEDITIAASSLGNLLDGPSQTNTGTLTDGGTGTRGSYFKNGSWVDLP